MVPIVERLPAGGRGYTVHDFRQRFQDICQEHLREARALVFAFVLYDAEHPEIRKVLSDHDYWNALDALSGDVLSVFCFHVRGSQSKPSNERGIHSVDAPSGDDQRQILTTYFKLNNPALPSVLFFQPREDGSFDHYLVTLKEETTEKAFIEIRTLLRLAIRSLSEVQPENRSNHTELFNLVRGRIAAAQQQTKFIKGVKRFISIKEFLSSLEDL